MGRPSKGDAGRRVRSFSYGAENDELIYNAQIRGKLEGKSLSSLLIDGLKLYSKAHWKDLNIPELSKALQERDQGPTEAERHGARVHVERLEQLTSKKWPNAGVQRDKLASRIQKALDFNERAKVPELSAAIERARSFAEKLGDLSKRGS